MKVLILLLAAVTATTIPAFAQCKVTETKQKLDGAERTVLTLENDRVRIDVVPDLAGRVMNYLLKGKTVSALEWLDDCPYNYGGRWEGKPFTYRIDDKGPDRAAVTVMGGGKIAVGLLHDFGYDVTNPLDLAIERTITLEPGTTRVRMDVKVTNTGAGVAPKFQYMVHAVYGDVPVMPSGRAFWFLPTDNGVEFFGEARGLKDMAEVQAPDNPFNRFTPGQRADKPRYPAGGWGAVMTSTGPMYIYYDPAQFQYMQYWFGGDSSWHFTFEPHTNPVDLKPGESMSCTFTLAQDSRDVPFTTPTISYEQPTVPLFASPGDTLSIQTRATTVRLDKPEHAQLAVEIDDPSGKAVLQQTLAGDAQPFQFTEMNAECKLPADAALGKYAWSLKQTDGKLVGSGSFEVMPAAEVEKRKTEAALAASREKYETQIKDLTTQVEVLRSAAERWTNGVDLVHNWNDPLVWPPQPAPVSFSLTHDAIPVLGNWEAGEAMQIKELAAADPAAWPADPEKLLSALKDDRKFVRDIAPEPGGLAVLLVDAAKNRTEIVRLDEHGIVNRFGKFAAKPGETDDTLGAMARALVVDAAGNIWVSTNAWGQISVYRVGPDGSPSEQSELGQKGAVKKFSPDGKLLGAVSLLDAPLDMTLAQANGTPVVLVGYRNVSAYHGAQVREGVLVIDVGSAKRVGEIKLPGGAVTVDKTGRLWVADVAGHVACFDARGNRILDVAASPAPAALDAILPAGSPLPVVVRADDKGGVWALFTLGRKLAAINSAGALQGEGTAVPATVGGLSRLGINAGAPLAIGDAGLWKP